eukprot:XP_001692971.1 predicted protein [Chlamydomonas reinhardtii]
MRHQAHGDGDPRQRRARILCLHGSRQDGELFSQRLKILARKLAGIADLHFVSSPHELPLSPGQSVAMRSWWRHWNLPTHDQDESEQGQEEDSDEGQDGAPKSAAFPGLKFVVCAGGRSDVAVPYDDSMALAGCFDGGRRTVLEHGLGHALPQKAEHTAAVMDFAIFMDEYRPHSTAPPRFTIHLREPGAGSDGEGAAGSSGAGPPSRLFSLTFTLPAGYPSSQPPVIAFTGPLGGNDPRRHALAAHLAATAQEAVDSSGAGCVFQVVEAAKDWGATALGISTATGAKDKCPLSLNVPCRPVSRDRAITVPPITWPPDPVTDEDGARVAAFPFTTIQPNVGRGYVLMPDPAPLLGLAPQDCKPLHGYAESFCLEAAAADHRTTNIDPLRRWDVAGLVPGAYQGRGRGNAFLNDLCDADVLIHVVDASGTTDREGQLVDTDAAAAAEQQEQQAAAGDKKPTARGGDPLDDVGVGVSVGALVVEGSSLAHWSEAHLHRLVAHFLQARFPILLALNKADMASSPDHIHRSPELAQQLAKVQSAVLDKYGGTGAALALAAAVAMRPPRPMYPVSELETYAALAARGIASAAGGLLGSGLDAKARAAEGATPGVLRDCVLLKPGSHIVDLFEVLKRPPYQLLEGDFVRAECSALTSAEAAAASAAAARQQAAAAGDGGASTHQHTGLAAQTWRVVKKDEVLDWGSCVARIMTNRRSNWQHSHAPKAK